jgi:transcriptional antiterminator RfaH
MQDMTDVETKARWYIMLVEPQREVTACAGLVGRRVQAYGPTFYKRLVRRGRKVEVQRPLFPGYIFARLVEGVDDFSLPKRVAGVRDYMRFYGVPCVLPDGMVEAIRSREASEYERYSRAGTKAPFEEGEVVRVAEGPFAGFCADVFSLDDNGRVAALVNIFGRKTKVQFEGEQLEKV